MTAGDWRRVLHEAAELGVRDVQFIGGEPTLYPALPELVRHTLRLGLAVEVYSNLARPLSEQLWALFAVPRVYLAASYYSSDAAQHDAITGRRSHDRTLANIREALRRGIPIRAGIVDIHEGQGAEQARAELAALGVERIHVDRMRQVGRGVRDEGPSVNQLCGRCADGALAVSPMGDVWPCVLARWLSLGNVRDRPLADIHKDAETARRELAEAFALRGDKDKQCPPDKDGDPGVCDPDLKDLPKK
jgi:MoaA/NifB/PqqE/SkfB family radical SAM enzyme